MGFFSRLFGGDSTPAQIDYSDRTDDELRSLAAARSDLTEVAQRALDEELGRRGLSAQARTHIPVEAANPQAVSGLEAFIAAREMEELTPEEERGWQELREALVSLFEQEDYAAVVEKSERAISIAASTREPALMTGLAHRLIAQTFLNRERWAEARGPLEKALQQFEAVPQDAAPEILQLSDELSSVHQQLGQLDDAEKRLRRAVEFGRTALPGEPLLAHLLEQLAALLRRRNMQAEAEALEQEATAIHEAPQEAPTARP